MFASDPSAPHRGIGPLQAAHLAGRLSAEVGTALADELSGPRGALLPLPNIDGNDPAVDALKNDIRGLGGRACVRGESGRSIRIGTNHQPVTWLAVAAAWRRDPVWLNRIGAPGVLGNRGPPAA